MSESTGEPIIERHGRRFHKMTVYDRADILRGVKKAGREQLLRDLREVGLDKEQQLGELAGYDRGMPNEGDFINWINTPDGKSDVLRRALAKADPAGGAALFESLILSADESLALVAELCGLELTKPEEAEQQGDRADAYGEPGAPVPPKPEEEDAYAPPANLPGNQGT